MFSFVLCCIVEPLAAELPWYVGQVVECARLCRLQGVSTFSQALKLLFESIPLRPSRAIVFAHNCMYVHCCTRYICMNT